MLNELHTEDAKFGLARFDHVATTHSSIETKSQVPPGMLWWNNTVVLVQQLAMEFGRAMSHS